MNILQKISLMILIVSLDVEIIENHSTGNRISGSLFAVVYAGMYGIFFALFMNKLLTNSE